MNNKIILAIVVIIVFGLVVALGYVVSQNSAGITDLFRVQDSVVERSDTVTPRSTTIRITSPTSRDVFQQGTVETISWTGGGPQVSLLLSQSSFLSRGAAVWNISNIRNTGSYVLYVPTHLSGRYTLQVTDGNKTARTSLQIGPRLTASGWSVYVDPRNLFEIQYPAEITTRDVEQEDTYPQKQYNILLSDFIKGVRITPTQGGREFPTVQVLTFSAKNKGLDEWLELHSGLERAYNSKRRTDFNSNMYRFRMAGESDDIRTRTSPDEMFVTVSGSHAYVILIDFASSDPPRDAIDPQEIAKTFRAY
ncbi:hypothetical protein A2755_02790 [Candidatus Wolfebacteria bacterium RIFCSPHIGHO2_01_FULL_48_22]|uniref:Uncharacterized protein n=2 Tax=Candidatus Wolfeibacteriota TaxID=1752735 RepID=A0A1F8DTX1_9BACT|nr:MAG: hypothetical protein A2755_02790 [Candidatus Wolfebacteria bacterium RIFCSPHIGHO2_01_FULL_48_22]OGM92206.1 MAG: hypothetical protein A2935_00275 [Candidatus Wolfebacteria bacterium RIFCSPLOWO2_01_FULL_47_17b]